VNPQEALILLFFFFYQLARKTVGGTMGRRKIKIEKVNDPNMRQVTFSKRRNGLFKKANELSILCRAEVAIVVFSPGNKPYSFGHPNIHAVATKFLHIDPKSNEEKGNSSSKSINLDKLNRKLVRVTDQLREVEKEGLALDDPFSQYKGAELHELEQLRASLQHIQGDIKSRVDDLEVSQIMMDLAEKPVIGVKNVVSKRKRKNE
jgi:hypothetical protein